VEGVIDEPGTALAVGRRLRLREARQSGFVNAAQLAVDVGGLSVQVRKRREGAGIFGGPVEAGARQKLHAAIINTRGHAKAVELYFVQPLRARRRLLHRLGELRRDEARKGRRTGLGGLRGRTLDDARHGATPNLNGKLSPLLGLPQEAPPTCDRTRAAAT